LSESSLDLFLDLEIFSDFEGKFGVSECERNFGDEIGDEIGVKIGDVVGVRIILDCKSVMVVFVDGLGYCGSGN